ncbi:uncharacterized protein MELLADRAFT_69043 [Melampsora larici-populina 98AG31]|uniref:Secreted protein n=1 Tax=Melampsora larici-populina (strain 98AG31 / pathotype 3-4-7) TaxID=747676 RepID=F4S973_MELLP|nr:uncharacterized protein MELLADRAFT_69043 [Melampsora larici-populina 98AG31]EGF98768.1 hypothetical protein MELLADRAFT_69043 [Melampsora larici-populina 98AG31]
MLMTRLSYFQIFFLGSHLTLVASHLWAEQPDAWRTVIPKSLDKALKGLGSMDDEFSGKFWHYALRRLEEEPAPSVNPIAFTTLFERLAVNRYAPQHHTIEIDSTAPHADPASSVEESQKSDKVPPSVDGGKSALVRETESKAEEIEYPGAIRACQVYFNKIYSGKIPDPQPEERSWFSQKWNLVKTAIPYFIFSRTIVNFGLRLNAEDRAKYVSFCRNLPDWIAQYTSLESRVNRMAMRVHHTSYLLSAIVMNDFEVDNVFKEVESNIGKMTELGSEEQRKEWAQEWLKIVQNHFQSRFASQPVTNVLSDESSLMAFEKFRLTVEQDQLRQLRRHIFSVVIGENPTGPISESMARLESFGIDFLPNFKKAYKHQQSLPVTFPNRERFLGAISGKFDWRLDSLLRNPSSASRAFRSDEIQPAIHPSDLA